MSIVTNRVFGWPARNASAKAICVLAYTACSGNMERKNPQPRSACTAVDEMAARFARTGGIGQGVAERLGDEVRVTDVVVGVGRRHQRVEGEGEQSPTARYSIDRLDARAAVGSASPATSTPRLTMASTRCIVSLLSNGVTGPYSDVRYVSVRRYESRVVTKSRSRTVSGAGVDRHHGRHD